MTPLAHYLAKQLTVPIKDRTPPWDNAGSEIASVLADTHFFECSEVLPLIPTIKQVSQDWFDARTFLPAPKTWIEFHNGIERRAILFVQPPDDPHWYQAYLVLSDALFPIGYANANGDYNTPAGPFASPQRLIGAGVTGDNLREQHIAIAHTLLVLINSPHIMGRTTKTPHRGLEKTLRTKYPIFGKYPLRAWSELRLEANIRHKDEHTGEITEACLTGKKCLHFCRQHLRIRCGRLELVSSHWRGDPALGIKRTRYRVTAPRNLEGSNARG